MIWVQTTPRGHRVRWTDTGMSAWECMGCWDVGKVSMGCMRHWDVGKVSKRCIGLWDVDNVRFPPGSVWGTGMWITWDVRLGVYGVLEFGLVQMFFCVLQSIGMWINVIVLGTGRRIRLDKSIVAEMSSRRQPYLCLNCWKLPVCRPLQHLVVIRLL